MNPRLFFFVLAVLASQTWYPKRELLDLYVAPDGKVEAYIQPPRYGGEEYVYRNFINMNPDTGELMLAFNVARYSLVLEGHIMTTNLQSGSDRWDEPLNATSQPTGYFHSNMVLWWDASKKAMVMVYQSATQVWWASQLGSNWEMQITVDAHDQTIYKKMTYDMGKTWTHEHGVHLLTGLTNPHVHFQIIESLEKDENGYPTHILLPVHHLSEGTMDALNWQMVFKTSREMHPTDDWLGINMTTTLGGNQGCIQASIVRQKDEPNKLVAFMRDSNGWWVRRTVSEDDGMTWSDPTKTPLPNPDMMSQAIVLHNGQLVFFYNPSQSMTSEPSAADRYSNTHHLAAAISNDYGMTWQASTILEYAYDAMYNYPVALQDPTCDNIYLTYSVMAREDKGCKMLPVCSDASAGTEQYIKFVIINEDYIRNQYDWSLDTSDACTWQIPESIAKKLPARDATLEATASTTGSEENDLTTLKLVTLLLGCSLGLCLCGHCMWCLNKFYRLPKYTQFDSDVTLKASATFAPVKATPGYVA